MAKGPLKKLLCLLMLGPLGLPVLADELDNQRKELRKIKSAIETGKKEVEVLMTEKSRVLDKVHSISDNISLAQKYLRELESTEKALDSSLGSVRGELDSLNLRIRSRKELIARRVRNLYVQGYPDRELYRHVGTGQSAFFKKVFFMKRLVRHDQNLVESARKDASQKEELLGEISRKAEEVDRFKDHKQQERGTYLKLKQEQESLLGSIQNSVQAKSQALKEMEENTKQLTRIIATLEKRRKEQLAKKKRPVLKTTGKRCAPVEGEIISQYGNQFHATLKTMTKNLGIELMGTAGTTIRAAAAGEVVMVTQIPGYGPGVIVENGGGHYTIYANLAVIKVREGQKVGSCEELASIPLNASERQRRVYFEVRKGTQTVDPAAWLQN